MIAVVATVLAAVALGVAAHRRAAGRAERAAQRVLDAMLYVIGPPVVFLLLTRVEIDVDVGVGILLAHIALVITGALAYLASRGQDRAARGAMIVGAIQVNTGYFGLPLTAALFGSDALPVAVAYDTLVQLPMLLLGVFAIGAAFGDRAGSGTRERAGAFLRRNPSLLAAPAGLLAPDAVAPDVLVDAARVAVFAQLPLGFFAVGVALAADADAPGLRLLAAPDRAVTIVLGLRLLVMPALLLALAAPLIDLPDEYLLLAACPTGIGALIVAHAYGLPVRIVVPAIVWSTAIVCAVAAATVIV